MGLLSAFCLLLGEIAGIGRADDQGNVGEFLVVKHVILRPVAVFAQEVAVIGGEDEHGVVPDEDGAHRDVRLEIAVWTNGHRS